MKNHQKQRKFTLVFDGIRVAFSHPLGLTELYLSEYDVKLVHTPGNKMVQSDALSQRPDLCPEEDNYNQDIVMLPDDMFLNLIDLELQRKIVISDDLDGNAAEALKLLLEEAPTSMTAGLKMIGQLTRQMDGILRKELHSMEYQITTRNCTKFP